MRAAGSGRSFSTSVVRGMGMVVEYSTARPNHFPDHEYRIGSVAADQVRNSTSVGSRMHCDDNPLVTQTFCRPKDRWFDEIRANLCPPRETLIPSLVACTY